MRQMLILAAVIATATPAMASPAVAQVGYPYVPGYAAPVTVGEQHRYEMDRLRSVADQNDALARRQQFDTRLTLMELEAARRPAIVDAAPYTPYAPTRTHDQQRALTQAQSQRRETIVEGVSQIDAWLDRPQAPDRSAPQ